jgi:hypothetical protein
MNEKNYVICGSSAEYDFFIREKCRQMNEKGMDASLSNFVFLTEPNQLRGIRNPHGWLYGNWKKNPKIYEILQTIVMVSDVMNISESIIQAMKTLGGNSVG